MIKDAEALERMEKVDTLVVDKTGTLTEGKPKVIAITPRGFDEATVLQFAASIERASEHPLAAAIVAAAAERNIATLPAADFDAPAGKGVLGTVAGKRVALGNENFLAELGITTDALKDDAETLRAGGATVVFVAVDQKLAGLLAIADPVKPTTPAALTELKARGIAVVMLTGDNLVTAHAVARTLGIDAVKARCCPSTKATWSKSCEARDMLSRWQATASTMRRPSPLPMSGSPWATAPMSRWRAPA